MAPDTKDRVLDQALALFNERGSTSVTTNHIAEALGMSPGNLYYHFRNKAEIVRRLFQRILGEWAENYALGPGELPSLAALERMAAGNFEIQWRYRFFFRDLPTLLAADAELARLYRENRAASYANTLHLLQAFSAGGVIEPAGDETALDDIGQLLWLVGDFWLLYRDTGGAEIGPADIAQGVRLFRRILNPTKG
jgi:AcrR family transcriptional regulator